MTLKKDSNFEEKLIFCLKNDMKNLVNFNSSSGKSESLVYFCRKYVMFELKKYKGIVSGKMTFGFKNDISNLVNFHTSS